MALVINESEAPISLGQLAGIERKLSIIFPDQYREFLLRHNGGRPTPARFRCGQKLEAYSCVDWFLAIYNGEYDNFESYYRTYKTTQFRLPAELVPIAHDPGGNLICIAIDGNEKGSIYFWDHEGEAGYGEIPTYSNIYKISECLDDFLATLT